MTLEEIRKELARRIAMAKAEGKLNTEADSLLKQISVHHQKIELGGTDEQLYCARPQIEVLAA